jgi:hypothetical protein
MASPCDTVLYLKFSRVFLTTFADVDGGLPDVCEVCGNILPQLYRRKELAKTFV